MSGFIGILNLNQKANPIASQELTDLTAALKAQSHRGPDGTGACAVSFAPAASLLWQTTPAEFKGAKNLHGAIAYNRFVTKTTLAPSAQPYISEDGTIAVAMDGELYNRSELIDLLTGCTTDLQRATDEVILSHLYAKLGFEKMLTKLNGMFSVAVIDIRNNMYFVARDRLGIKPLYYAISQNRLLFASELKAFTCLSSFENRLDPDAYNARLIFSRPGSKVLLKDVEMLNPGEYIAGRFDGSCNIAKWFSLDDYERSDHYTDIVTALKDFSNILEDAVNRQLDFDVPFATQVSGGIDSTLVNYYIKKLKGNSFKNGISIIDGTGHKGEEYWIDRVADAFDLELQKYQLDEKFFLDNYKQLVWFNDAPIYKPYFTSFYKMAHSAKGSAKILLSGEGADETAGGYGRFAAGAFQPFFSKNSIQGKGITPYDNYAAYAINSDQTIRGFTILGHDNTEELINEQIDIFSNFKGSNFTKQLKYETYCRLPESFMRQEKMASANSIEIRVPLVDYKVLDFVMQLPESMLLAFVSNSPIGISENPFEWIQGKYIFKELCAQKMGRDFAYRNKQIIVFDERNILKSDAFRTMFYDEILPSIKSRGLIDAAQVENWYSNISSISQKDFNIMWRAISLETWCSLFLNK